MINSKALENSRKSILSAFYCFLLAMAVALILFVPTSFASAASTFGNNVSIGGTLTQTGAATFDGVIQPASNNGEDIGAYGAAWSEVFASGTVHIGEVTSANESTTAGDVNIGGQLVVDDEIFASSTITVQTSILPYSHDGADIGTNGTAAWNDLYTSGTAFIGDVNSSNQATTAGDVNIGGQLVVDDEIYASSTITVQTSILPYSHDGADIGTNGTAAWNDLYTSGTAFIGDVNSSNQATTAGDVNIGGQLVVDDEIYASSTITVQTSILPYSHDGVDVGGWTQAFNDVFASGTMRNATSTTHNTTGSSTLYIKSGLANVGGRIVIEDLDGAGCSQLMVLNGTLTTRSVTCPDDK